MPHRFSKPRTFKKKQDSKSPTEHTRLKEQCQAYTAQCITAVVEKNVLNMQQSLMNLTQLLQDVKSKYTGRQDAFAHATLSEVESAAKTVYNYCSLMLPSTPLFYSQLGEMIQAAPQQPAPQQQVVSDDDDDDDDELPTSPSAADVLNAMDRQREAEQVRELVRQRGFIPVYEFP
eukprot:615375-Rhodomonas_salina.1